MINIKLITAPRKLEQYVLTVSGHAPARVCAAVSALTEVLKYSHHVSFKKTRGLCIVKFDFFDSVCRAVLLAIKELSISHKRHLKINYEVQSCIDVP